ncbi:MAG: hypothetical protein KC493_13190 [Bacteriovoracaceae bacterium]|nr:hypothetical protein [Bacteriovoracaceae bacterium]
MRNFSVLLLSFMFVFSSCTKKGNSEDVLKGYVKYRFSPTQSKDELLGRTTGTLNDKITEMNEEAFKDFVSMEKFKMRKFEINLKRCSEDQCFITYTLSYDQYQDGKRQYENEVKKIAEIRKIEESWKIADVSNVKTYIDSKEEITVE